MNRYTPLPYVPGMVYHSVKYYSEHQCPIGHIFPRHCKHSPLKKALNTKIDPDPLLALCEVSSRPALTAQDHKVVAFTTILSRLSLLSGSMLLSCPDT